MRYWIALCFWFPLFAFDLSIQSGREENENFSILHLRDKLPFSCQAFKNDFDEIKKVECILNKAPIKSFPPIDNPLLSVHFSNSKNGYLITIAPKSKIALKPVMFNLSNTPITYESDVKQAVHWMLIGYHQKLPLISPHSSSKNVINFPVKIMDHERPFVGGLDLKGNPIKIRKVQDATDYMEIKKAYSAKNYDKVLQLADSALREYPNTVFKNELLLYKIRSYHENEEYEKLLETSKTFLFDYSSDPNIAEVLAYTANGYSKIGQIVDADYFFDRLFNEHTDSTYATLGMIYKAEQLEMSGNIKKAMNYYQKALASSKDIKIASKAAFKLAQIELNSGNTPKAAQYIEKIATADPQIFVSNKDKSMEMAASFLDRKDPQTAFRISEILYNETDKKSSDKELLLRNMGIQLAKAKKRNEALKRFNEYLETYKHGEYAEEIRRAKDGLFFDADDKNSSNELKKYDDLIERYGNDSIGRKALYKKAQLLLKEKKYKDVLELENELYRLDSTEYPETNSLITKSAIGLEKQLLQEEKCIEAMRLQKMYKIKLLNEWDELVFSCALKTTQYNFAKLIAKKHLQSKSIPERQIWLSRMVKTQFGLGEYKEAIKGGDELITLLGIEKNPPLNDIYRTMYDAAQRVGDSEGMIRHIKSVETAFGNDFKDIERYTQMVSLAQKNKDESMTQTYGRKVMALQERTKTYTQSPYIEFTLAQSYQNLGKEGDALKVLKTLNTRKLTKEKRSRQQYLIGSIEQKLGHKREARDAFNASIKADPASAWGKLAKDALTLF